jgi:D-aspartate ligase
MASRLIDAVIVGFETNGLGVARALAKEHIAAVAVTGPTWHASWHTRYARKIVRCREWSRDSVMEALLALGKQLPEPAPLLITKDEPVLWISACRAELSRFFKIALPDEDTVQLLMSKVRFEAHAKLRQWPVPASWSVSTREQLEGCIDSIVFPCILKTALKNTAFRKKSPSKAFKLRDREELLGTYDMVREWEPDAIIQEWIPGGDDRVTYGLGCWSTTGTPVAVFAGRKLRQWPPECGGTAIAAPAPEEWAERIIRLTTAIMGDVGYRGLGSVEFKMRSDGSPVIMEPTVGRTNYQNEVAVLNGVNIPAAAYFDLLGRLEESRKWMNVRRNSHPVKLIDSDGDNRSAALYLKAGKLTAEEWRRSRSGPRRFMIFRLDDPMPSAVAFFRRASAAARRRLARLTGAGAGPVDDRQELA